MMQSSDDGNVDEVSGADPYANYSTNCYSFDTNNQLVGSSRIPIRTVNVQDLHQQQNIISNIPSSVGYPVSVVSSTSSTVPVGVNQLTDSLVLIGLSNDDEADCEYQTSSNNSPFQSAAEDVISDGEQEGSHPLLLKSPPRQSVFHQFLKSGRLYKSKLSPLAGFYHNTSSGKDPSDSCLLEINVDRTLLQSGDLVSGSEDIPPFKSKQSGRGRCSIGIFLAAVSCVFFATSALIVKISSLHPMELLGIRGLLQVFFISPIVFSSGNSFLGPDGSRSLLLSRAVLGSVSLILSFASIHLIPLADAATCIFTSPVFVSLFACICLGELCSWFDVIMISLTLVGVVLVSQPSFSFITSGSWASIVGTVCGLAAAMLTALAFIVLRQLKHVHYSVTVFWFSSILAAFGGVLTVALDGFTVPKSWSNVGECLGIGVCGFLGQILLTKALQMENAGPCAVARTLDIVIAFFYQITFLHDSPNLYSVLGSVLVVSCVLLTALRRWYREKLAASYHNYHHPHPHSSANSRHGSNSSARYEKVGSSHSSTTRANDKTFSTFSRAMT